MKKTIIVLICLMTGFAQFSYLHAERRLIYSFDTADHNAEDWIYYADQLIFDEAYLCSDSTSHLRDVLTQGNTYLLKVTHMAVGIEQVDSCFTTFTYVPEGYDPEDPYVDNGTLAFSDQSFGFYNIVNSAFQDPDLFGEDGDYTEEEIEGILSTYDYCFIMAETSYTRIKIEIYEY